MGTVIIKNLNKTLLVEDITRPLLHDIQLARLDWMHACGGKGRCTTCKVRVIDGIENLSSHTPAEEKYLAVGAIKQDERLACQVRVEGDITIEVPEECKLPHLSYSDDRD